jgi:hypothetical protein
MTINARTLTPEQYAALKRDVLADAATTTRNREPQPNVSREPLDALLASPQTSGNASSTARPPAPFVNTLPATVAGMTDAQYTARKQAFIRGEL